ncbi:MAG: 50S ribosomal protein L10 [Defluviitaleaceae bacterium]|nr:50S ribosomal protein L10 [Defluviitaleaceae bacterium]
MSSVSANLANNRKAKEVVVDEIRERLSRTKSVVLVDSRGLTVEQDTALRKSMRKAGGIDYKVYKNTMMAFAIDGTDFAGLKDYLSGPTAVAFSYDDATAAAATISKQLKGMPNLEFKASAIDGEIYDAAATKAIADIPPREVLLSRLLGSLKSPLSSFARVINAIAEKDPSAAEAAPAETTAAEAPVEAPAAEEATAEAPAAEAAEATPEAPAE